MRRMLFWVGGRGSVFDKLMGGVNVLLLGVVLSGFFFPLLRFVF